MYLVNLKRAQHRRATHLSPGDGLLHLKHLGAQRHVLLLEVTCLLPLQRPHTSTFTTHSKEQLQKCAFVYVTIEEKYKDYADEQ